MKVKNRIAEYRKRAGKSQTELCQAIGQKWKQTRLSMYEQGHNRPSLDDCRRIVDALNKLGCECSLDDVFPPAEEKRCKTRGVKPKTNAIAAA